MLYKPGIKAAEYRLEGSEKNVRIAKSSYYPQLSFSAGLGTNFYTVNGNAGSNFGNQMKNNLNKYAGFSLNIPLFNRLATRNRVRTARLQQTNLALQLDNTKKVLYKEIQQAWYNAIAAESKFKSSESAVEASQESFRLMSEKFDNGKATSVEYNESKLNLTKALSDRIQAKYDYLFRTSDRGGTMVLPLFFITFQAIQKIKGEIPIPPFTNQNYNLRMSYTTTGQLTPSLLYK